MTVKNLDQVATVDRQCCSVHNNTQCMCGDSSVILLPPRGLKLCEGASKMEEAEQSSWTNCKVWR